VAVAAGQFVYLTNHDTLADGIYRASAAIATNGALSTSNLTADASGGLNALNADIANIVNPKNLGSQTTIDGLKTAITNAVSNVANGATVPIRFPFDAAIEPFARYAVYEGTLYKYSATIWSGVFTPNGGTPVYIANTNGTWTIEGIALNSKFTNYSVGAFSQLNRTELSSDSSSSQQYYTVPADGWYHLVVGCTTDSDEAVIKMANNSKTILYAYGVAGMRNECWLILRKNTVLALTHYSKGYSFVEEPIY